jgi:hypothetical protein
VPSIKSSDQGASADAYPTRAAGTYDTSYSSRPPASLTPQESDDPASICTTGENYPPLASEASSWTEPARTNSYE